MSIDVEYLPEARSFVDNMPEKARKKMLHNVALVSIGVMDSRIFKKLGDSDKWSFVPNTRVLNTDYFHFGIKASHR